MAGKKDWRTIVKGDSTGRFTREQIRDAVDAVASKTNGRSSSKNGGSPARNATESRNNQGARSGSVSGKRS